MGDMPSTVGIDGCAAGWIIASVDRVVVIPELHLDEFDLVGVDMPIGLVDGPRRACDIAARKFLGRAGSSVFPAPPRSALAHADYRAALTAARTATGRGISKQTFNLMPKIGELDRLISPTNQHMIVEVHPECAFKILNEDEDLPSKKTAAGQDLRQRLLAAHFDVPVKPPPGAAVDDLLDAYAVLWSAQRYRRGVHQHFGDGQCDERGIEMRIVS
jgi:predicted RNase H-like nuclease